MLFDYSEEAPLFCRYICQPCKFSAIAVLRKQVWRRWREEAGPRGVTSCGRGWHGRDEPQLSPQRRSRSGLASRPLSRTIATPPHPTRPPATTRQLPPTRPLPRRPQPQSPTPRRLPQPIPAMAAIGPRGGGGGGPRHIAGVAICRGGWRGPCRPAWPPSSRPGSPRRRRPPSAPPTHHVTSCRQRGVRGCAGQSNY